MNKTRLKARIRLFHIWQVTGKRPFRPADTTNLCPECGQPYKKENRDDFFRGSFDSIPFLNDEAKRTFVHLLLRPGYMIRDYIRGLSSSYLAPFTALIIFYAFLALVSSIAVEQDSSASSRSRVDRMEEIFKNAEAQQEGAAVSGLSSTFTDIYIWLHLDTMPEEVDTRLEQSVAALETALRSQGVTRFLGSLILMTLGIWMASRRKYGLSFSASATTASYILCQFCFFMLFAILVSLGQNEEIGLLLMAALMTVDFHQMLGISWKRSFWQTIKVGLAYLLIIGLLMLLAVIAIFIVAACIID